MPQKLDERKETPSQTAGPYLHIGLAPGALGLDIYAREPGRAMAGPDVPGERIRVEGLVLDGNGAPLKDALIEIWQADAGGRYPHPEDPRAHEVAPGFRGWGRAISDFETGLWAFETIKPGPVPGRNGAVQAPHLGLWIVARGINIGLHTRLYFADEAAHNAKDPVLNLIEPTQRRASLIAPRAMAKGPSGDAIPVYRFDIRLQGEGETVFLDI